jgi:hypothetical protein
MQVANPLERIVARKHCGKIELGLARQATSVSRSNLLHPTKNLQICPVSADACESKG